MSIGWYLLLVIAHTLFILCSCSALVSNVTRWRRLLLFLPATDTGWIRTHWSWLRGHLPHYLIIIWEEVQVDAPIRLPTFAGKKHINVVI